MNEKDSVLPKFVFPKDSVSFNQTESASNLGAYISVLEELRETLITAEKNSGKNLETSEFNNNIALTSNLAEKQNLHFTASDGGVKLADFLPPETYPTFSDEAAFSDLNAMELPFNEEYLPDVAAEEKSFDQTTPLSQSNAHETFFNKEAADADSTSLTSHEKTAEFSSAELISPEESALPDSKESDVFDLSLDDYQPREAVPNYRTNPELFIEAMLNSDNLPVSIDDKYLVFNLDENFYAFPAANIVEISRPLPIASLPGAPHWLLGVVNLRGDVVPILSLRHFWGKPFSSAVTKPKFIILRSTNEDLTFGILVDQVREIRHLTPEKIFPPNESYDTFIEVCLQGVSEYDQDHLLLHLDAERFFSLPRLKNLD